MGLFRQIKELENSVNEIKESVQELVKQVEFIKGYNKGVEDGFKLGLLAKKSLVKSIKKPK